MKFTKEPPYEAGCLACIINATIDVLKMNVTKVQSPSLGEINKVLIGIGYGYQSSTAIGNQWLQFLDMHVKMNINDSIRNEILESAESKLEHLKAYKTLI